MKFTDAVRHLEDLGLLVQTPSGRARKFARRVRNPLTIVPVRIVKDGKASKKLLERIRESRAETRNSSRARKKY